MGTMLKMHCECGYIVQVTIGGTRATYTTICKFPHYCENCGVVSANTYDDPVVCPNCKSEEIIRYGNVEKDRPSDVGIVDWVTSKAYTWDPRVTEPVGDYKMSCGKLHLTVGKHLCPQCKKMSLCVDRFSFLLYD